MATVAAGLVKDLREKTGAGMMDCKNALSETDGDIEAAIDWLRKKGLAKAAKKSGRVAAEGLVGVAVEDNVGVLVEVNSETDFVARNDDFQAVARGVLAVALDHAPDVDAARVLGAHYPGGGTVTEAIANAIATIGENMTLRRAQGLRVAEGAIGRYVHGSVADGLGRIGVIVALKSTGDRTNLSALGRQIAMHVAAASPVALDAAGLKIAARIDHEANAKSVGLDLAPTVLFIFGNPKAGTLLMEKQRTAGIDLPLKILMWDDNGKIKVAYNDPAYIARRHGLDPSLPVLSQITMAMQKFATAAVSR